MLDERKLMRKIKKKVWDSFQSMEDELDFLARLRNKEPDKYTRFVEENLTNEEGLRLTSWVTMLRQRLSKE